MRHLRLAMRHLHTRRCCYYLGRYLSPCRCHLRLDASRNCMQLVFQAGSMQKTQFSTLKP
ncbi:hypothetical protein MtrunA17_Chr4g0046491 [Medicago truncatula]|uniref:Uncharacterized protein n=1 Tax=Medicago truncatula TaxID=3880 RepID=A0A396I9R4_MEDTR|nr:hypothetical protein MtrunA17_Chr4g0046491 [Medicago truncatula]